MEIIKIKTSTIKNDLIKEKVFENIKIEPNRHKIKLIIDFLNAEYEFMLLIVMFKKGIKLKGYFDVLSCVRKQIDSSNENGDSTTNLKLNSEFVQIIWNFLDDELKVKLNN